MREKRSISSSRGNDRSTHLKFSLQCFPSVPSDGLFHSSKHFRRRTHCQGLGIGIGNDIYSYLLRQCHRHRHPPSSDRRCINLPYDIQPSNWNFLLAEGFRHSLASSSSRHIFRAEFLPRHKNTSSAPPAKSLLPRGIRSPAKYLKQLPHAAPPAIFASFSRHFPQYTQPSKIADGKNHEFNCRLPPSNSRP